MSAQQPPLVLKPFYIHTSERISEIAKAMNRYASAGMNIPNGWLAEFQSLTATFFDVGEATITKPIPREFWIVEYGDGINLLARHYRPHQDTIGKNELIKVQEVFE